MENKTRLLKRNPEPTKTLSRPQPVVTQPKEEPAKPQPTPDTGVGGSSLDTMTGACATEMMNAAISFHKLHLKVTGDGSYAAHKAIDVDPFDEVSELFAEDCRSLGISYEYN